MKLPNGERAVVSLEKLTEYCLNPDHPRGKHKARVFRSACGFTAENADHMRQQLLEVAADCEAQQVVAGPFQCSLLAPRAEILSRSERTTLFRQTDSPPNKWDRVTMASDA